MVAASPRQSPRSVTKRERGEASVRSSVQSVRRAFAILDILKDSSIPLSAREISALADLDRTVVHRLLRTLAGEMMVVDDDRGAYSLGPASVLLANRYHNNLLVRRLALPYLLDLQASGVQDRPWTVTLMIPVGDVVTVIERIWTKSLSLDMVLDIGDTFPIDLAAAGRAVLAYRDPAEVAQLIGDERGAAVAPTLQRVRDVEGVALSRGEAIPGIEAISAAVLSRRGNAVAAVAVSGLSLGDQMSDVSPLAAQLRRSARAIGQSLP